MKDFAVCVYKYDFSIGSREMNILLCRLNALRGGETDNAEKYHQLV